jgi:DNA-binding CsgD family transcriptional regulator
MLEASGRVVQLCVGQLNFGRQNVEQLTSGLALGSGPAPAKLVDWNEMTTLFERAREAVGGLGRMADLYEATFLRALPEGFVLMKLAPDALSGTRLLNSYVDASFFVNVRYQMTRISQRKLRLAVRIPQREGHRDCPAFFHVMAGNLRASSGFAGLSSNDVRMQVRPFAADYELMLPKAASSVAVDSAELAQQEVKATFLLHCENELRKVRQAFLELHRTEVQAAESASFAVLSGVVSRALAGRERRLMPIAAVQAISDVLGCRRVAIKLFGPSSKSPRVLAELGPPMRGLTAFETEVAAGLLVLEADVARGSPHASALNRLAPWLALLFSGEQDARVGADRAEDWAERRLAELARRWHLTPRQEQVAWLMVQGETNKGIAHALACAEGTVELHTHAVLAKSGLRPRSALAAYFYCGT